MSNKYVLSVPGMSCMHCYRAISNILKEEGINDFEISLEKKQVIATTNDIESLRKILAEAGYETHIEA